ncbi:response regulator transcription factor [Pedobacter sp. AW31-3R]|uniref:response regulator transcription factor n=1 Tax=Pedobacter sp. AW31-3R TaxID=3445781 RepID=UPI003FA09BB3
MIITRSLNEQLSATLLEQPFGAEDTMEILLNQYRQYVQNYVSIDNNVSVLSDFKTNRSYIYAGSFGKFFGLPSNPMEIDSAFEELIFNKIHPDDLVERHVLELRYFQFQKSQPQKERPKYSTHSRIRACNAVGKYQYINHRTLYPESLSDGSIWLALCIYMPSTDQHPQQGIDGKIMNNETGEVVTVDQYQYFDQHLLTDREREVLGMVARGMLSKQIADQLNIAISTVHRHRQNIIRKMQVINATEAVKTGIVMGII